MKYTLYFLFFFEILVLFLGNFVSLIALLQNHFKKLKLICCNNVSIKLFNTQNHQQFKTHYIYLTGLAFCDLFSCILTIISVLQFVPLMKVEEYAIKYRELFLYISLYITPIANAMQALSVWLICAFSIHRCQFISKPFKKSSNKQEYKNNCFMANYTEEHYQFNCKNNRIEKEKLNFLQKFYKQISSICNCFLKTKTNKCRFEHEIELKIEDSNQPIEKNKRKNSQMINLTQLIKKKIEIKRPWVAIITLYIFAFLYIVPQIFEKKIVSYEINSKIYHFTDYTQFGKSSLFRQIYHLWLYMLIVLIVPFILILTSNFILLNAFLKSKRRLKNKNYSAKDNSERMLTISKFHVPSIKSKQQNINQSSQSEHTITSIGKSTSGSKRDCILKKTGGTMDYNNKNKLNNKRIGLTISLFGVVLLFLICHVPQIVSRIIDILFPDLKYNKNSKISIICMDVANFFIMLNSSINFVPYIAFGPRKFRRTFSNICLFPIHKLLKVFMFLKCCLLRQ